MNYMDVKTAASKWELTERRITMLCRDGRIEGAKKESGIWLVPANADKPEDGRSNKVTTIMKNSKKYYSLLFYLQNARGCAIIECTNMRGEV